MGVAAEANRIAYGNWRLSCGAAAFFIHKTISRNGGINMKELWNTAQVIFAAIGGWAISWAAAMGCSSPWWYSWRWITSQA